MIKVTFTDEIEIITSTEHLYQWDVGQVLEVSGLTNIGTPMVHFGVKGDTTGYAVQSQLVSGKLRCGIPDIVLQSGKQITAYIYVSAGASKYTDRVILIPVIERNKPNNYTTVNMSEVTQTQSFFDSMVDRIALLEARMNTFTSLPNGSTSADAEVTDARIDDVGYTHENIGNAIRSIGKRFGRTTNLIDPSKTTDGFLREGNINEYDYTYLTTTYIPVTNGATYYAGRENKPTQLRFVNFFNGNKEYISELSMVTEFTINNENVKYIRVTYWKDKRDGMYLNENTLGVYEPYFINDAEGFKSIENKLSQIDTKHNEHIIPISLTPTEILENTSCGADGGIYSSNGYTTKIIPIVPNGRYYVSILNEGRNFAHFLNGNGEFISLFTSLGVFYGNVVTIPENVHYIRYHTTDEFNDFIITEDDYIKYGAKPNGLSENIGIVKEIDTTSVVKTSKSESTTNITLGDFPQYLKTAQSFSFKGEFETFNSLTIGKGYNSYRGRWLVIDNQNISYYAYENSSSLVKTVNHNLTITDYISVVLDIAGNDATIIINTTSGTSIHTFDFDCEACGTPFVLGGNAFTNAIFNGTSKSFRKDVWLFGDSYFGVSDIRVIGQLKNLGIFENVLVDGLAGQSSVGAFTELDNCLRYGKPKYLVWCLGMNDDNSTHSKYLTYVKQVCSQNGINLILATIPTVPARDKETITANVRNSGYRYIDFYNAVGANSNGEWYSGYLSTDNVHPTELGAKALAMQFLIDFPELAKYRN